MARYYRDCFWFFWIQFRALVSPEKIMPVNGVYEDVWCFVKSITRFAVWWLQYLIRLKCLGSGYQPFSDTHNIWYIMVNFLIMFQNQFFFWFYILLLYICKTDEFETVDSLINLLMQAETLLEITHRQQIKEIADRERGW